MSATRPASKTELKNYALRRLGYPTIDINVATEQLDDLVLAAKVPENFDIKNNVL